MIGLDDIRRTLASIAPRYGISRVWLFGSYARAEQGESSDVDLVVELERPLGFKRAALHDEVERALGLPVDIVFGESQLYAPVREQYLKERVALAFLPHLIQSVP